LQVSREEKEEQFQEKRQRQQQCELEGDPMTKFMYALKAKESKMQYPRRFKMFLANKYKKQSAMDRTKTHGVCIFST
jgi:hypothetical protein